MPKKIPVKLREEYINWVQVRRGEEESLSDAVERVSGFAPVTASVGEPLPAQENAPLESQPLPPSGGKRPKRQVVKRLDKTDESFFRPYIFQILLEAHGHMMTRKALFAKMLPLIKHLLKDDDTVKLGRNSVRWHNSASGEKKNMEIESFMESAKDVGIGKWKLTPLGVQAAKDAAAKTAENKTATAKGNGIQTFIQPR